MMVVVADVGISSVMLILLLYYRVLPTLCYYLGLEFPVF
jgi:hypothetical protein